MKEAKQSLGATCWAIEDMTCIYWDGWHEGTPTHHNLVSFSQYIATLQKGCKFWWNLEQQGRMVGLRCIWKFAFEYGMSRSTTSCHLPWAYMYALAVRTPSHTPQSSRPLLRARIVKYSHLAKWLATYITRILGGMKRKLERGHKTGDSHVARLKQQNQGKAYSTLPIAVEIRKY